MVSDIRRYIVVSVALVLFLAAAQASAGLSWRNSEPARVGVAGLIR